MSQSKTQLKAKLFDTYVSSDSYYTKKDSHRAFGDKLSMGSTVYFGIRFIYQLLKNRKLALQNKFDRDTWAVNSLKILQLIESCGGKFQIEGLDNIDKVKEPVVIVSNHMSMLESMIFPGLLASKREVTFVVKSSLVSHPLFGPVMQARKPISVERKDPIQDFKKVMNEGLENLENNTSVVIFPQSKRMVQFDPEQFNTLGIKLAKKAKVQIIPVAIKTDFWKNGRFIKDIGKIDRSLPIHIKFGEPFAIEGNGKKEHQQVVDFITKHLAIWNK